MACNDNNGAMRCAKCWWTNQTRQSAAFLFVRHWTFRMYSWSRYDKLGQCYKKRKRKKEKNKTLWHLSCRQTGYLLIPPTRVPAWAARLLWNSEWGLGLVSKGIVVRVVGEVKKFYNLVSNYLITVRLPPWNDCEAGVGSVSPSVVRI